IKKKFFRYQAHQESECEIFEKLFSTYSHTKHSLLLTSGTNALYLALISSGIKKGDEVLIPAYTFVGTAASVLMAGGIPVIVNIDSQLSMSAEEVKNKITNKTKAIILVHMDGLVANVKGIKEIADKENLILIEDVAQAIGATYQNEPLGSIGKWGCYSLNENKNISCGEGGILTTSDTKLFNLAFQLHDTPVQFSPTKKNELTPNYNYLGNSMRVSEIQGVIMQEQLKKLPKILNNLRERKKIYSEILFKTDSFSIPKSYDPEGECGSSIHLQFHKVEDAIEKSRILRENKHYFGLITSRPAHSCWSWSMLLNDKAFLDPNISPYFKNEKKYQYSKIDWMTSIDIVSRTVKMDIDFDLNIEDTEKKALEIKRLIS
ncbi:MAG: aminotransferase class I/II-fold pyridoxal phosphate-dependent enzyme, partial [Bdellovibrionales bacterium]|nr:aminotransferase class I/II-fold pyridoxal phosphate-dependent enzyme [Bdellovibrionales bacterium]